SPVFGGFDGVSIGALRIRRAERGLFLWHTHPTRGPGDRIGFSDGDLTEFLGLGLGGFLLDSHVPMKLTLTPQWYTASDKQREDWRRRSAEYSQRPIVGRRTRPVVSAREVFSPLVRVEVFGPVTPNLEVDYAEVMLIRTLDAHGQETSLVDPAAAGTSGPTVLAPAYEPWADPSVLLRGTVIRTSDNDPGSVVIDDSVITELGGPSAARVAILDLQEERPRICLRFGVLSNVDLSGMVLRYSDCTQARFVDVDLFGAMLPRSVTVDSVRAADADPADEHPSAVSGTPEADLPAPAIKSAERKCQAVETVRTGAFGFSGRTIAAVAAFYGVSHTAVEHWLVDSRFNRGVSVEVGGRRAHGTPLVDRVATARIAKTEDTKTAAKSAKVSERSVKRWLGDPEVARYLDDLDLEVPAPLIPAPPMVLDLDELPSTRHPATTVRAVINGAMGDRAIAEVSAEHGVSQTTAGSWLARWAELNGYVLQGRAGRPHSERVRDECVRLLETLEPAEVATRLAMGGVGIRVEVQVLQRWRTEAYGQSRPAQTVDKLTRALELMSQQNCTPAAAHRIMIAEGHRVAASTVRRWAEKHLTQESRSVGRIQYPREVRRKWGSLGIDPGPDGQPPGTPRQILELIETSDEFGTAGDPRHQPTLEMITKWIAAERQRRVADGP
ncbi:MAG: hypothetical protein ACRCYU_11460, partial [Nocardioides sp.]